MPYKRNLFEIIYCASLFLYIAYYGDFIIKYMCVICVYENIKYYVLWYNVWLLREKYIAGY